MDSLELYLKKKKEKHISNTLYFSGRQMRLYLVESCYYIKGLIRGIKRETRLIYAWLKTHS